MDGFYWCKVLRPPSIAESCGMKRLFQSCLAERSSCTADTFGVRHYFRCQSLVYDAASPVPLVCELIAAHSVGAHGCMRIKCQRLQWRSRETRTKRGKKWKTFLGVRCPSEKDCAEQRKKDSVYPIGDGEKEIKIKPGAQTKKGPTMGLEPTWV